MQRRDTLRKCAVLGTTGGLSLLAGCSGGGGGDENDDVGTGKSSLSVETFDYREGDSGNFVATVTVTNSGDSAASGKLYLDVTAAEPTSETETEGNGDGTQTTDSDETQTTDDGDDTTATRKSQDVTVPAGEMKTVSVPFEFSIEQFERQGSLEVDLRS